MATPKGEIVRVPGMPPMYDHEYAPQPVSFMSVDLFTMYVTEPEVVVPERCPAPGHRWHVFSSSRVGDSCRLSCSDSHRVFRLLEGCDGVLLYTTESYEPVAVKAMRDWFSEASRGVYVCGPLVPIGRQTAENQTSPAAHSAVATETILNKTLESSGKRSLLYVCQNPSNSPNPNRTNEVLSRFPSDLCLTTRRLTNCGPS